MGGITLECGDDVIDLHFTFGGFVSDGLALKMLLGTKGATGSRMCHRCINALAVESDDLAEGHALVCNFYDSDALIFASNAQIRGSVDRLAAFVATNPNIGCAR